jgi:hypothetical protein
MESIIRNNVPMNLNIPTYLPMRDIVFISHSNPKDNRFALWLTHKLTLAGYKVWCDLTRLIGGERDYWKNIEDIIRLDACKFLLVVSRHTFNRDGVLDEYEFARSIQSENKNSLPDFVIPLKIDGSPYNARIGLNRYNLIKFVDWKQGVQQLLTKLKADNVPTREPEEFNTVNLWYQNSFALQHDLVSKEEVHYSNLWPITNLPENIYLYQYNSEDQADCVAKTGAEYPIVKHGNYAVSFSDSVKPILLNDENSLSLGIPNEIAPRNIIKISVSKILNGYENNDFPTFADAQYFLKRLLNRSLHLFMKNRSLHWHDMSGKVTCYYYHYDKTTKNKSTIVYPTYEKTKNLIGDYFGAKWHFGISSKVMISPFVAFSLRSHILFSDNGSDIWNSPDKLHSARRAKGRRWYNEEWRDQLLAFIASLKSDNGSIAIRLNDSFMLNMPLFTVLFSSNTGYDDPVSTERMSILHTPDEEDELYENINVDNSE